MDDTCRKTHQMVNGGDNRRLDALAKCRKVHRLLHTEHTELGSDRACGGGRGEEKDGAVWRGEG